MHQFLYCFTPSVQATHHYLYLHIQAYIFLTDTISPNAFMLQKSSCSIAINQPHIIVNQHHIIILPLYLSSFFTILHSAHFYRFAHDMRFSPGPML